MPKLFFIKIKKKYRNNFKKTFFVTRPYFFIMVTKSVFSETFLGKSILDIFFVHF